MQIIPRNTPLLAASKPHQLHHSQLNKTPTSSKSQFAVGCRETAWSVHAARVPNETELLRLACAKSASRRWAYITYVNVQLHGVAGIRIVGFVS